MIFDRIKKTWKIWVPILLVWFLFAGIKVPIFLNEGECHEVYGYYILPNYGCQKMTMGHCKTTFVSKQNAYSDFGQCLCEKYEAEPTERLRIAIEEACTNSHCDRFYKKEISPYAVIPDKNVSIDSVEKICEYRGYVFSHIFLM